MASVVDIIVLDDGDDDEGPSYSPEAKESPSEPQPPPPPEPQSSGKKDGGSSQNKVSMTAENQKLFEEFVDYCSCLTGEHPEVITFLQSRFSKANATYLSSVEFRNTLGRCLTRVQGKQSKVYVYINELCTVLKNHSEKKKVSLQTQATTAAPPPVKVEVETLVEDAKEEVQEKKPGSKHQIRRLEKLLRLYTLEIQKLQERELSLEEMDDEDSSYIQESRLKQKMLRIFEKLCELKDCSNLTGRVIDQRIQYQGTRDKEINRRLEKFINKNRDIFPDYSDILQVVQKANERHNLGLARKQVQSIAQDAFRELGNKLQHRRHLDMVYNFGSHLTDSYKAGHDPAEQDSSLARRLRENRSLAENRLEDVIRKFADMQDEGEEEDWKNKSRDDELPSTSKGVKSQDSPRSRKSQSPESEEDEDEDEESEESDVDIEEELRQSQEAADGEEDEETPVHYLNETDQKMEETSNPQNFSPAGKEYEENEESDNSDQTGDEAVEEATDKDEDQDLSSGLTSPSPEKEDVNPCLGLEGDAAGPASSGHIDAQLVNNAQEDHAEEEKDALTSGVTSDEADSGNYTMEHLEMSVFEEDFDGGEEYNARVVNVPYKEAKMPSSKEQGTKKCTDTTNNLVDDSKSPTIKRKDVKVSRLDKCINKLTGSLGHKDGAMASPSAASGREHFRQAHTAPSSPGTPRTEEQSRNLKLLCVDSPAEGRDSVRKVAFSHSRSADQNSDVVHLDSCKNSTNSDANNGVHRAMVVSASPVNRLKRKRDAPPPTDSVYNVKVEELGAHRRKRKTSPQLWTGNGVAKYNGAENGKQQHKSENLSSSYTSCSSPSEPCSDNEHDITLDLRVTCSPQMTPSKTSSQRNKIDAATQCDPDEVIVLSD